VIALWSRSTEGKATMSTLRGLIALRGRSRAQPRSLKFGGRACASCMRQRFGYGVGTASSCHGSFRAPSRTGNFGGRSPTLALGYGTEKDKRSILSK